MTKRDFDSPARRLRQLERVLTIVEILAPRRYGLPLAELVHEVCERTEEAYCERTVRRDLNALEMLGVVEQVRSSDTDGERFHGARWQWVDRSLRATIYSRVAELRAG